MKFVISRSTYAVKANILTIITNTSNDEKCVMFSYPVREIKKIWQTTMILIRNVNAFDFIKDTINIDTNNEQIKKMS